MTTSTLVVVILGRNFGAWRGTCRSRRTGRPHAAAKTRKTITMVEYARSCARFDDAANLLCPGSRGELGADGVDENEVTDGVFGPEVQDLLILIGAVPPL